jgi:hypothetical protein
LKTILYGLALAALPISAASAQSMNAEIFHKRAVALKKKGPMAIFSRGEIRALMTEGKAAGMKAREERLAAVKAGRAPPYCPLGTSDKLGSDEFMERLGAIPATDRGKLTMTQAMTRVFAAKFPCKA